MKLLKPLLFTFAFMIVGVAQPSKPKQPQEIVVQSWQKGSEKMTNQRIKILLTSKEKEYKNEIVSESGKRYQISVIHNPIASLKLDHWKIELREILLSEAERKEVSGDNLLAVERSGPERDNFPRGDFIGYIYPKGDTKVFVGGVPWTDGFPFYPIKAKRVIKVEDFYVSIKVEDFKLDESDKNKLDSIKILIEFSNTLSAENNN